ncbi:GNAT family N-acetyltransferase [Radiobacillus deserti]|uniref:GNAT family N-acetyltransferase n=1 Tax=Radiobacillus deserti TaxID=2594883 RepID=A0A516KGJ3_9BACI|nr:GNAT family N-acetyltransferase [Radiobacillus deserti]QDP40512.1 GNAT family N-acetyltransferase [Radiobacillus deserti]
MLIRYKKSLEKIAMGLLSFMPEEKEVKKLQHTMKEYETNEAWHLYLWKEDDILGAIGIELQSNQKVLVQHITVNPSYRGMGIGKKMLEEIQSIYEGQEVISNDSTKAFLAKLKKPEDT